MKAIEHINNALFIYLFDTKQAKLFNDTVLKIEGENISAYEVAHEMELLRANIELRKSEKYIDPNTEREQGIVIATGQGTEDEINALFEEFYGMYSSIVYIVY